MPSTIKNLWQPTIYYFTQWKNEREERCWLVSFVPKSQRSSYLVVVLVSFRRRISASAAGRKFFDEILVEDTDRRTSVSHEQYDRARPYPRGFNQDTTKANATIHINYGIVTSSPISHLSVRHSLPSIRYHHNIDRQREQNANPTKQIACIDIRKNPNTAPSLKSATSEWIPLMLIMRLCQISTMFLP